MPHWTMKNTVLNIIECCNNTHQGAPHTGKQCAKMCCACNTRPKLALRTSVTVRVICAINVLNHFFVQTVKLPDSVCICSRVVITVTELTDLAYIYHMYISFYVCVCTQCCDN